MMCDEEREQAERCDDPTPHELAAEAERDMALARAVESLPEPAREAVRLRHWSRWSYEQIGAKLGKSATAVDGILRRAHRQLNSLLRRLP